MTARNTYTSNTNLNPASAYYNPALVSNGPAIASTVSNYGYHPTNSGIAAPSVYTGTQLAGSRVLTGANYSTYSNSVPYANQSIPLTAVVNQAPSYPVRPPTTTSYTGPVHQTVVYDLPSAPPPPQMSRSFVKQEVEKRVVHVQDEPQPIIQTQYVAPPPRNLHRKHSRGYVDKPKSSFSKQCCLALLGLLCLAGLLAGAFFAIRAINRKAGQPKQPFRAPIDYQGSKRQPSQINVNPNSGQPLIVEPLSPQVIDVDTQVIPQTNGTTQVPTVVTPPVMDVPVVPVTPSTNTQVVIPTYEAELDVVNPTVTPTGPVVIPTTQAELDVVNSVVVPSGNVVIPTTQAQIDVVNPTVAPTESVVIPTAQADIQIEPIQTNPVSTNTVVTTNTVSTVQVQPNAVNPLPTQSTTTPILVSNSNLAIDPTVVSAVPTTTIVTPNVVSVQPLSSRPNAMITSSVTNQQSTSAGSIPVVSTTVESISSQNTIAVAPEPIPISQATTMQTTRQEKPVSHNLKITRLSSD